MKSWQYELGDVLLLNHKGSQVVGRVSSYEDSLDNTKPLYVNLRVSGGLRWGERQIKIQPEQIIRQDETWYERQHAAWEASIKKTADEVYAKMSPGEKQRLHDQAKRRRSRSPLDIMIDKACGLE